MKDRKVLALFMLAFFLVFSCSVLPNSSSKRKYNPLVKYAGVRSSIYGIEPFPIPAQWKKAIGKMENAFPATEPLALWTVATVNRKNAGVSLEFPSAGTNAFIEFATNDRHQRYLRYFDRMAISVVLQIEPGYAPVETLIDLVMTRYTNHPCVIGIGIDGEWYRNIRGGGNGMKVNDSTAASWEKRLKRFNTNYHLFLKHFDVKYLPDRYRGDIVFIDDSQNFRSIKDMAAQFYAFAERFYPNVVMFQVGYPSDRHWWKRYKRPQEDIGDAITEKVRQEFGIIWVDFTMKDVLLR